MRIAVVRNQPTDEVIFRSAKPCPERYGRRTIRAVVEALEQSGHVVSEVAGGTTMLAELDAFLGSDAPDRANTLVMNMAYGIQGDSRYTHVPAMLEMAGVPYTGAGPLGHAVSLDKVVAKALMADAGIPTPRSRVMSSGSDGAGLAFPLVVKPRHESTSYGLRLVRDAGELGLAVEAIVATYRQEALVEEYVDGREVCVGLLGNDPPEILPPVELDFGGRPLRIMTWDDKYHRRADEPAKICPAPLTRRLRDEVRRLALATFEACHARDYARVDIRIDASGRPFVLEINSMASLGMNGSFVHAAREAGMSHRDLVARIIEVAAERSRRSEPPPLTGGDDPDLQPEAITVPG